MLKEKLNNFYEGLDNTNKNIYQIATFFTFLTLLVLIVWIIVSHLDPNCGKQFNKVQSLQLYKEKKNAEIFDIIQDNKLLSNIPHNDYTFGFWIYLDGWYSSSEYGKWKHIFHIGTMVDDDNVPNKNIKWNTLKKQTPGVWLLPDTNKLRIVVTTQNNKLEYSDLTIDIKQWVNIIFVLKNRYLEVYKNGKLIKTTTFTNVPSLNKDTLYVNYNKGYTGFIKNIEIIPKSIEPNLVERLYQLGNSK